MNVKPYLRCLKYKPEAPELGGTYPYDIPALRDVEALTFHPDVTFFVGENGSGKSTVLEAIALLLGLGPEGGTRNSLFSTANTTTDLHEYLRPIRGFKRPDDLYFLRAESFYNLASYMDQTGYLLGYGGKSLHARSHGEAFMATLQHKLKGRGLYLFDEPEAALSPSRQLSTLRVIHELVKKDSQFIIATHSPILMAYPNARIFEFGERGIREVRYQDTEHYTITRQFLAHPDRMLQALFTDDEGD